jgi:hypothetical protein
VISVTDDFRVDSSQTDLERLHHAERILHVHREDVLVHLQKEKQNKVKAGKTKSDRATRALQPRSRQARKPCAVCASNLSELEMDLAVLFLLQLVLATVDQLEVLDGCDGGATVEVETEGADGRLEHGLLVVQHENLLVRELTKEKHGESRRVRKRKVSTGSLVSPLQPDPSAFIHCVIPINSYLFLMQLWLLLRLACHERLVLVEQRVGGDERPAHDALRGILAEHAGKDALELARACRDTKNMHTRTSNKTIASDERFLESAVGNTATGGTNARGLMMCIAIVHLLMTLLSYSTVHSSCRTFCNLVSLARLLPAPLLAAAEAEM